MPIPQTMHFPPDLPTTAPPPALTLEGSSLMTLGSIRGGTELPSHSSRPFSKNELPPQGHLPNERAGWLGLPQPLGVISPCMWEVHRRSMFPMQLQQYRLHGLAETRDSNSISNLPIPQSPCTCPELRGCPGLTMMGNVNPRLPPAFHGVIISLFRVFKDNLTYS